MKLRLRLTQLLIGIILAIIVYFYYKTELVPFHYEGYSLQVSMFQKYNAELDESIVGTRFGLIRNYDSIVESLDGLHHIFNTLETKVQQKPETKILESTLQLKKALEKKDRLIDDFKRINPILINAVSYFSKLTSQVIEAQAYLQLVEGALQQTDRYLEYDLLAKLNSLYRDIVRYTIDPDPEQKKDSLALIEEIRSEHSNVDNLELVLQYATVILDNQPQIAAVNHEILELPILELLENLNKLLKSSEEVHLRTADLSRLFLYGLSILLLITVLIAFNRLQNMVDKLTVEIALKQKAEDELAETNRQLEQRVADRTRDLAVKNKDLENTLKELHDTQDQLVIQEKMASVGMLTTGIAHEIKNPLNFINNFSQISDDLVTELMEELKNNEKIIPKESFTYLSEVLQDLKANSSKIYQYGQRADNIVESMLFHSQDTSARKEMTNINLLLKDAITLATQSMKQTNSNFEYEIKQKLDEKNPLVLVSAQAVSRVFLYILSNGLWAMEEKRKKLKESYNPILNVTSESNDKFFKITIRDNGIGIPEKNMKKIFEPFYTTKPTGRGNTGLGLSICYDTIVKQHKGELAAISKEGEFTEITIKLPLDIKNITENGE